LDAAARRSGTVQETKPMKKDQRAITIHFADGSKMSLDFPKQAANEAAAFLKFDDVLKKRYMLFEADSTLLMVPFENVKYVQFYPAPADVPGHTYVKGATVAG
jgi:hypothetical protein